MRRYGANLANAGATRVVAERVPFLVFSRRVFSLSARTRWWIFEVHSLRVAAGALLLALAWCAALPGIALGTLFGLAAARLVVSRLPVPNKDMLFANLAIVMIGEGSALAGVVAFTVALTLVAHLVVLVGLWLTTTLIRDRTVVA